MLSTQYKELAALAMDAGLGAGMVTTTNTIGFRPRRTPVHRLSTATRSTAWSRS